MAQQAEKRFQHCRWYDPYPRLAFALKLVGLAPAPLRTRCWQLILSETEASMIRLVQDNAAEQTLDRLMQGWLEEAHDTHEISGDERRRSLQFIDDDASPEDFGLRALLMLKNSPDAVKHQVTGKLLAVLT